MPVGAQGHLGIRKESSFASGGAVDNWQTMNSESLNLTFANVYSDRIASTPMQVDGQSGLRAVAGDIVFPVTPSMPSQWLECGIGQSSSPYYPTRTLSSMLVQIDHETAAVQASGCMVGSLALASSQGGELTMTATLEGAGFSSVTAGSPSYSADAPYLHQNAVFKLNGTTDTSVTDWNISIDNNLVTDLYGTDIQRVDIAAGKAVVSGSFTKLFDDTTERNQFLNAGVRSFWVKFTRGSNYLTVYCPKVLYDSHTENISGQSDYILETFNFTGYIDDPDSEYSVRVSGDFS